MENIIFLSNNSDYSLEGKYFAIEASKLVKMPLSDTYDKYGNQLSVGDCGDSLELLTQKAVDEANQIYYEYDNKQVENYSLGDIIFAYEEGSVFNAIIASDLVEGEDYNLYQDECIGFNYWDGNKWKSVIVSDDNGSYYAWEVLEDKELTKTLLTNFEDKELVSTGFGKEIFETEGYKIVVSNFSNSWEIFTIEEK